MCWERRQCSKKFVVVVSGLTKGKKKKNEVLRVHALYLKGCSFVQLRRTNIPIKKHEETTHFL
jgi:hypothetical protein